MEITNIKLKDIIVQENIRTKTSKTTLTPLMASIQQHGLKQPIGVSKKGDMYTLIWGYRRMQACIKLGYETVPAIVETDVDFKDLLITNAIENLQRKDISPDELGRICTRLEKMNLNQREIAVRMNIPLSRVQNCITIYKKVPSSIRDMVVFMGAGTSTRNSGKISASAMSAILKAQREFSLKKNFVEKVALEATRSNLSIRQIGIIAKLIQKGFTVDSAIKKAKEYQLMNIVCLVNKNEIEKRIAGQEISGAEFIRRVVFGDEKPLTKIEITIR